MCVVLTSKTSNLPIRIKHVKQDRVVWYFKMMTMTSRIFLAISICAK